MAAGSVSFAAGSDLAEGNSSERGGSGWTKGGTGGGVASWQELLEHVWLQCSWVPQGRLHGGHGPK